MVAVWAHGTSVVPFPTHLVEGWRWALTKRNFLSAIILGAIVNIACVASITGAQIMLAARGANAVMIGLLGTAMGVSTLVGSLLANKLVDMVPTGKLIAGALTLFVVSQMPLLFLHSYAAILICQILAGLPFPALNAGLLGFLYGKTPDNMQGRASAVFETTVGILGAACPAMVGWLLQARSRFHGGDGRSRGLFRSGIGRIVGRPAAQHSESRPVVGGFPVTPSSGAPVYIRSYGI